MEKFMYLFRGGMSGEAVTGSYAGTHAKMDEVDEIAWEKKV